VKTWFLKFCFFTFTPRAATRWVNIRQAKTLEDGAGITDWVVGKHCSGRDQEKAPKVRRALYTGCIQYLVALPPALEAPDSNRRFEAPDFNHLFEAPGTRSFTRRLQALVWFQPLEPEIVISWFQILLSNGMQHAALHRARHVPPVCGAAHPGDPQGLRVHGGALHVESS
jgi:hypothetical protein